MSRIVTLYEAAVTARSLTNVRYGSEQPLGTVELMSAFPL
jgi:hypothetical protein